MAVISGKKYLTIIDPRIEGIYQIQIPDDPVFGLKYPICEYKAEKLKIHLDHFVFSVKVEGEKERKKEYSNRFEMLDIPEEYEIKKEEKIEPKVVKEEVVEPRNELLDEIINVRNELKSIEKFNIIKGLP